jgi:hypothetical protein
VAFFQDLPGDVADETRKRDEEKFAFVHIWRGPLLTGHVDDCIVVEGTATIVTDC